MSRSPHRLRADPSEVWERLLLGELMRAVDRPLLVRDEPEIRLPGSGRWETGLARVRPAFDDALGDTALAVAWRWACASLGANGWPGLPLLARKATDQPCTPAGALPVEAVAQDGSLRLVGGAAAGDCSIVWTLRLAEGEARVGLEARVGTVSPERLEEVDRVAWILAAWLDGEWFRAARGAATAPRG